MTKEEKQKMMDGGAVFESADKSITYSVRKTAYLDHNGNSIGDGEWERMTPKLPVIEPDFAYSREFEIIPPDEMARLMVAGEVLEFQAGGSSHYDEDMGGPFWYVGDNDISHYMTVEFSLACRVRQAPKTEKRWQWNVQMAFGWVTTDKKTAQPPKDMIGCVKIDSSEEDFEIGAE